MLRRTSRGLLAAVISGAMVFTTAPAVQAADLTVWTMGAADRPFSSSPPGGPSDIDLHAARGESEAAQVLVRSASTHTNVRFAASTLTGPNGATIPSTAIRLAREYNHPRIDKGAGDVQHPPDGGTAYYDALVDNTAATVPANYTQAYFYQVRVPAGQAPGRYTGSVTITSDTHTNGLNVPVALTVHPVTLPAANQSTFLMNNWFTSYGWDYTGTINSIPMQYGVQLFDANWWRVITNFAANHARHRNNVIFVDPMALAIRHTTIDSAGRYTFGWETFDRFVQIFIDAGAMQYIYTPHLLEHQGEGSGLEMIKNVNGVMQRVLVPPMTAEANAYVDQLFASLRRHLDAKGWTDKFYFSAMDEPKFPAQQTASNWLYDKYRQHFPPPVYRTNEAHGEVVMTGMEHSLTTVTPYTGLYRNNVGYYERRKLAGVALWLYTCIVPQDDQMNRFIAHHLARTRMLPWLTWKIGGTGYLHWGWNYWFPHVGAPDKADTFDGAQTGDNWLVRPNKAAYDVYDSIRSEAQLDGLEDFELLNLLSATKPVLARSIANSLITDFGRYTRSGADVDARHRQILHALSSPAGDAVLPFSDDFGTGDHRWQTTFGQWSVSGGEYVQAQIGEQWGNTSVIEGRAYGNAAVSVDLRITGVYSGGGDTNWAGLMVRSQNGSDIDSGYLVGLRNNGQVFVNRAGQEIGAGNVPGYVKGGWTRLRVLADGNRLTVWAGTNHAPVLTVTDSGYRAGNIALVTGGAAARFDNVRINPVVNVAEGRAVTATSTYDGDGWGAGAAVDGVTGSAAASMGWSSLGDFTRDHTESLTVDFGASRPVNRIDLYPRSDGANAGLGFPVDFTIAVSNDNTNWTTVATRTGYARPGAGAQAFPVAATTARYLKITGTKLRPDQFGNFHLQLAEVQAIGGNLASGAAVVSSSSVEATSESWLRGNLTDGVVQSNLGQSMGFSSAGGPNRTEWVTVDLGGVSTVSRVDLYPRGDGANTGRGFPIDFTIAVSSDNVNWTNVLSRTGYPRPGATAQTFTFAPASARYVRVTGTNLSTDQFGTHYLQLAEFEVR